MKRSSLRSLRNSIYQWIAIARLQPIKRFHLWDSFWYRKPFQFLETTACWDKCWTLSALRDFPACIDVLLQDNLQATEGVAEKSIIGKWGFAVRVGKSRVYKYSNYVTKPCNTHTNARAHKHTHTPSFFFFFKRWKRKLETLLNLSPFLLVHQVIGSLVTFDSLAHIQ